MAMNVKRREFLTAAAATAASGVFPVAALTRAASAQGSEEFRPDVEIDLVARPDRVPILPGRPTEVWGYEGRVLRGPSHTVAPIAGTSLGPILRLKAGDRVRIRFRNQITQPTIVHWHGMIVPERMDGHPRDAVAPGGGYLYEFEVRNRAGTYWFHPHPHGLTGPQVNAGLAGLLLVSDEAERALKLPEAEREIPIVLSDRTFDGANQLVYVAALGPGMMGTMTGFVGERILANGRPSLSLSAANDAYRIRLLNGSNSRIYRVGRSDGKPLVAIAADGGLLAAPETKPFVVLGPGERVELWLDLHDQSMGSRVALVAQPIDFAGTGMMGGMMGRGMMGGAPPQPGPPHAFAVFTVDKRGAGVPALPDRLAELPAASSPRDARSRRIAISVGHMQWGLNGRTFSMEEVAPDERVRFGDTEIWEFANLTRMMALPHPIHVHGVQFRVLERRGETRGLEWLRAGFVDSGLKDTVLVLPGESVRFAAKFDSHRGMFLYHCHNLEHEDMGMMRNYLVA